MISRSRAKSVVGNRYHEIRARLPERFRLCAHRLHLIEKFQAAGLRHERARRQRHAEDADLQRPKLEDASILVARQGGAIGGPQIGREIGELRFARRRA